MKILLTGKTGFVGQQIAKAVSRVHSASFLVRNATGDDDEFIINIGANEVYASALDGISVVIHCAAKIHSMNVCDKDSLEEFRDINTRGTLNLAQQAARAGVKRFIFLSSIKVNGEYTLGDDLFTHYDEPAPLDSYGVSKAEAEKGLLSLGELTGMEIVIIRPPLIYGEGVKANFASLMRLVGKGFPLPFRCITNNKRSLVSVYNLVDLIKVCIEHPNAANQIFLVSDDNDLSTAEMVSLMAKVQLKKNIALPIPVWCFKLVGMLFNKRDVVDRLTGSLQVDITHTKKTLNWKPPYSVEHGFKLSSK